MTSIGPEHLELVGYRRERRARERRGDRGAAVGRHRRRARERADELEPFLAGTTSTCGASTPPTSSARDGGWRFRVGGRELVLRLPFAQRHLAENALAALTAYDALGLPLERAQEGADRSRPLALAR